MKKTKSIIILISVFFAFISTVNAKEYKSIEELMKDIPSSLTLDIKDIDLLTTSKEDTYNYFESISNSIEEKVTKKLSSILGINLEDLTINGKKYYFYEFTEYDENDLNPYNLRKRTFRISDHEDLDLEKNITIHYTNDNKYNETDKKYVENATKNIYTAMYLTSDKYSIFGSDLTDEFSEYTEFVEYSINNKNVKLSPIYSIGMGGSYLSSGMSVLFYVIYKDVVYSSYVGNISIYTNFDIPSNIADTEKAYIDYVKPILKSKYNINVKSYKPVSNNLYDITFDECEDTNECWEMEERIVIGKPGIKRIMDNVTIDTGRLFPSGTILPENNSIYKELKTKVDAKNYNVLAAYDLKTTSGALYDDATLTFTIGNQYNGKKILLVSKNGNNIQEVSTIAKNGQVSIKVRALYPFMLGVEKFTDIIYNNSTKEWEYYKDGIFTPSYSGVAANKNGTYYVDKGVITFNHNELINYNKNWVAVINSKLNPTYTGISTNKNGSYYLEKGKLTFKYNGTYKDATGNIYILKNSKVDTSVNGLKYVNKAWYYFKNGKTDLTYTGTAKKDGAVYYVNKGIITFKHNELVYYNKNWVAIVNSKANPTYTGLLSNTNGTYLVEKGKVTFKYNGTYKYNGKTYTIKNSKVVK